MEIEVSELACGVIVRRSSILSKDVSEMPMKMGYDEFLAALDKWRNGANIQDAFPELNEDEREFIQTGITPEAWNKVFSMEEE